MAYVPEGFVGWLLVDVVEKSVIPSPSHDGIMPLEIFLAVQLVYGRVLGLLPAMVCCIQSGLRTLMELFFKRTTNKNVGERTRFPL